MKINSAPATSWWDSLFLNELLERINELKIGNPNARLSTKIAALIFLLVISKKYIISTEDIASEFDISISTFKTFYMEIYKNKHLINHELEKYNIELPSKIPRKPRLTPILNQNQNFLVA